MGMRACVVIAGWTRSVEVCAGGRVIRIWSRMDVGGSGVDRG